MTRNRCVALAAGLTLLMASPALAQESSGLGAKPYVFMVAGNVADLVTTLDAFRRGAHEGNTIVFPRGRPAFAVVTGKAVAVGAIAWVMRATDRRGHPGLARAISYVDGSAMFAVASHNLRTGRGRTR